MSVQLINFEKEKNKTEKGVLYLVATPIGNLSDISERALKVLTECNFIAAEDTRNSQKLISCYGIKNELISYHEHNKSERGPQIIERLKSGETCALITDAGTPAISDPGEDLVKLCADNNIKVISIPGACAAICALTMSGLPTGKFVFEGFLPTEKSERRKRLELLKNESRTIIFHEAPHKLKSTLSDFSNVFGNERRISLCREMTKINEEITRTTVGEALEYYNINQPKGEYVLVVEGNTGNTSEDIFNGMSVEEHVAYYIEKGFDKNSAIKATAKDLGVAKNDVYMKMIGK